MKFLIFVIFLIFITIPYAFATSLENTELNARSGVITLNIEFREDKINQGLFRITETAQLENVYLSFYGDEIVLTDPKPKVLNNHFRISSIPEGVMMFGHKNTNIGTWDIDIYFATNNGLLHFPVTTHFKLPENKIAETKPPKIIEYLPKLEMTMSNDFRTYWNDEFNFDVQVFDTNINRDPKAHEFEGRVDGVDITAIISFGEEVVTTLKGITQNGHWDGAHYIPALSPPGEYTIDIIASLGDQTISQSSSMFVLAHYATGPIGSSNKAPTANAGNDDSTNNGVLISLDGSGSTDPENQTLTFSWTQLSGPAGTFVDTTTDTPDYTPSATGTAVFELTVTDPKGKFDTDTVTITVS